MNLYIHLSVKLSLTCAGNFEALMLGYMKGASVSTNNRSKGIPPSDNNFLTPLSDLSLQRYPVNLKFNIFITIEKLAQKSAFENLKLIYDC